MEERKGPRGYGGARKRSVVARLASVDERLDAPIDLVTSCVVVGRLGPSRLRGLSWTQARSSRLRLTRRLSLPLGKVGLERL